MSPHIYDRWCSAARICNTVIDKAGETIEVEWCRLDCVAVAVEVGNIGRNRSVTAGVNTK